MTVDVEVLLAQADAVTWRRPLLPWESSSAFAAIDAEVGVVARTLAGLLAGWRADYITLLAADLARQPTSEAVIRRAMELDANGPRSLPGAAALLAQHEAEARTVLTEAAEAGAGSVVREAAGRVDRYPVADRIAADIDVTAIRVVYGPHADLLRAVREEAVAATRLDPASQVAAQLVAAARNLSDTPLDDYAATGASNVYGRGRVEQAALAGIPERIYASELLDANTCGPCADVDGREYATLGDARVDYPDGYYRSCQGGVRCRGTIVLTWPEAAPTGG